MNTDIERTMMGSVDRSNQGITEEHLHAIKKFADTRQYRLGDSLESVAWRQAQRELIDFIEHKILTGRYSIEQSLPRRRK